ncbi:MAG: hypothetical protein ACJ781_01070, partial [Myxococcales bacterium]
MQSVVADAGMAEVQDAGAGPEDIERLAQRHIESAAASRHPDEECVDHPRRLAADGLVSLARERPVEDGGSFRERLEVLVMRVGDM